MKTLNISSLVFLVSLALLSAVSVRSQMSNHIVKESPESASASSSASSVAVEGVGPVPPPAVVAPPPVGVGVPPFFPGFSKGAGFHKNLDLSIGGGAGAGYGPLLASLLGGAGPGVPPPVAGAPLPPAGGIPPPPGPGGFDPLLGGPGYMGFPGFLGPSYIPYSWLGSALGAKGDLLFPIVMFIFVVVGTWTVVQFLLGLIVPLIAGKLAVGKSLLESKKFARAAMPEPEAWNPNQAHQAHVDSLTDQVMPAIDHNYGDSVEEIPAY